MNNLLEPWVLLRIVAGLVAFLMFVRGAMTAQKVLRRFDVARATEGQLALERQMELASTFVRVGAVVQVLSLALSALASDRLSRGVRGAMCAYGVFGANEWGFRSLAATAFVALAANMAGRGQAVDRVGHGARAQAETAREREWSQRHVGSPRDQRRHRVLGGIAGST